MDPSVILTRMTSVIGSLVARGLVVPLPIEVNPGSAAMSATASTSSETGSPIISSPATRPGPPPCRALDQLILILRNGLNVDGISRASPTLPPYPVEIRANICSLLGQLTKQTSGESMDSVKDVAKPVLEELSQSTQTSGRESILGHAAKKVLDMWMQV